jgi:hypothetical protein
MAGGTSALAKIAWRIGRFLFWAYRKVGPSDFNTSMVLFLPTIVLGIFSISLYFEFVRVFVSQGPIALKWFPFITIVLGVVSAFFGIIYTYRLRAIGITSADTSTEAGLDYQGALAKVSGGFDFLGIGASKLTGQKPFFRDAVSRMSQHQQKVRILLCDPRSKAIDALERKAGVDFGRYKTNVKHSFSELQHLRGRFRDTLEIRIYNPLNETELPSFRMMFLNAEICLISPVILGAPKEGRMLPQLHIVKKMLFGLAPNFYHAFDRLFLQLWENAKPIDDVDFEEIAQLGVTHAESKQ